MHGQDGQTNLTHRNLQVLSVLLVYLPQTGFMGLPLLPQCILYSIVHVIPHSMQIALKQLNRADVGRLYTIMHTYCLLLLHRRTLSQRV